MNYSIILKTLSSVMWIMALAFSACAGVSAIYADNPLEAYAMQCWVCVIALSITAAIALYIPSRNAAKTMFRKEAMCIIGIAWFLTSAVGALPYAIILDVPAATAFFESASGITTTGASIFGDFSIFAPSLMFWRCLSHWIGGLGVVVFFVAVLSFLGASGKILYSNETGVDSGNFEAARIRSGVMTIVKIYITLSVCCFAGLRFFGMDNFDAVCHAFSIVSTGGFSTKITGIAEYGIGVRWCAIVFMFLGGTSFALLAALTKFKFNRLLSSSEFWTYVLIIFAASAISVVLLEYTTQRPFWENLSYGVFEAVSSATSTGLFCDNRQTWLPAAQTILLMVGIVGGCSGSASGGLKVSRVVASFRICKRETEKSYRPRVVRNVFLNGKVLDDSDAGEILSYVVLYILVAALGITVLSLLEPKLGTTGTISAVFAMLSNTGPGLAEVGCDSNYGILSNPAQFLLSIFMIMGRLEFYAVLVLIMPSLWKKFQ